MKKKTIKIIFYLFLAGLYLLYVVIIKENSTFLTIYLVGFGLSYISNDVVELIWKNDIK